MLTRWTPVLAALLAAAGAARADVKLPSIFSDHAVFQADAPVNVWGWADPGEKVSVSTFPVGAYTLDLKKPAAAQVALSAEATAGEDGKWAVRVGPFRGGEKITAVVVRGRNELRFEDVLVGEVWLCSGQSNMAFTVARSDNFEQERAAADHPGVRMFLVANNPRAEPQGDVPGKWLVCSPQTVGAFSGTAYFFGRKLHRELKTPVGLINSSVGGTPIEAWTSVAAQQGDKRLQPIFAGWADKADKYDPERAKKVFEKQLAKWKEAAAQAKQSGGKPPRRPQLQVPPRTDRNYPGNLFNGMIAPLIPYTIRGAIWYQGENNANREFADLYRVQLPMLVRDWRSRWGHDFPFLWVQLPNFRKAVDAPVQEGGWPLVREGMLEALQVPGTGMAVTIDIGDPADIHPTNKQDFGGRLARVALADVYKKDVVPTGPLYQSHKVAGGKVVVTFRHADGLKFRGGEPKGFAVAGQDRQWHRAAARIDGDTVTVWSPDVPEPVAVRYAWADNPEVSLTNGADLPASPFRTDEWKEGK